MDKFIPLQELRETISDSDSNITELREIRKEITNLIKDGIRSGFNGVDWDATQVSTEIFLKIKQELHDAEYRTLYCINGMLWIYLT